MSNRPALEIRQGQHLALTPQLQQSIRLLQLSSVELEMEISQALIENPLLERDDDPAPAAEAADPEREDAEAGLTEEVLTAKLPTMDVGFLVVDRTRHAEVVLRIVARRKQIELTCPSDVLSA